MRPLGGGDPSAFSGDETPLPSNLAGVFGDAPDEGDACLVVIRGPEVGRSTTLGEECLTIGRSRSNDLRLGADSLSRFHCKLERVGDAYQLEDLGSTNGTFVNGDRVVRRRLEDGNHVQVGKVVLKFIAGRNVERLMHKALRELRTTDGLTGLGNRLHLFDTLSRELRACVAGTRWTALTLFKIKEFSAYNATYGDGASDMIIRSLRPVFERRLRSQDVLCRYAEDMFGAVMPGLTLQAAKNRAAAVSNLVDRTPIPIQSQKGESLASVQLEWGAAATDRPTTRAVELFGETDEQLHLLGKMRDEEVTGIHRIVSLKPEQDRSGGEDHLIPRGDQTLAFVVPPELRRSARALPVNWLGNKVGDYAARAQAPERLGLIVCTVRDPLGALAQLSSKELREAEREIIEAVSGWNRDVFKLRDGTFLCFADVLARSALEEIARSIEEDYRSRGEGQRRQPLPLCFGFALAESFDVDVEPLQRLAMADLIERGAVADQGEGANRLPHPIAWSLENVRACTNPDAELRATILACERTLQFGAMVMLGGLLSDWVRWASHLQNASWFEQQLAHQRWSTGDWWQLTLGLAKLLGRAEVGLPTRVARCFVRPNGKPTDGMKAASGIVELRNRWAHGRGFIGHEGELRRACPQARSALEVIVQSLAPLGELELATVAKIRALRTGGFECTIRKHTGPDLLFIAEERRLSQALTESTYLFDWKTGESICLWPYVVFESCPLCSYEELFWTLELRFAERVQYEGIITAHELTLELPRPDLDDLPGLFKR